MEREMLPLQTEAFYGTLTVYLEQIDNPGQHFREVLLPMMDVHRRRDEPMPEMDIMRKLFSDDPEKPGELREWLHVQQAGLWLAETLEGVDLLYYFQQPNWLQGMFHEPHNAEERIMLEDELDHMAETLTRLPAEIAYRLCIIKYLTRMNITTTLERHDRNLVEAEMAIRFLEEPDVMAAITEFWWDNEVNGQERVRAAIAKDLGKTPEELDREADEAIEANPEIEAKAKRILASLRGKRQVDQ